MKEINELTRRLLAEGWNPEDTPPGTRPYNDFYGGWTYTSEAIRNMVWETPCGLLAGGKHFLIGHMSYRGIDWTPENGIPVLSCPVFPSAPCPLQDPLLSSCRLNLHPDNVVYQCACHRTDRPYTYQGSVDEVHDQLQKGADKRWKVFKAKYKGRVCRHQCHYDRTSKAWRASYDPIFCARTACGTCGYCSVLGKELAPRKGNVFYDLRKSWIVKGEGLFPDQQKVVIEKGRKLLQHRVSLTICEAIVQYGHRSIEDSIKLEHHSELFFNKTMEISVINLRAARVDTKDTAQDLQDTANGIQVIHTADSLNAAKEQKRAKREAAKEQRIQKAEKMILAHGWEDLETVWRLRAERWLDADRIGELIQHHKAGQLTPAQVSMPQLSIYEGE